MKLFEELRKACRTADISQVDIANEIKRSPMHVSNCFNCKGTATFTQPEMYTIMDMIGADYADMPKLFPKNGIAVHEKKVKQQVKQDGIVINMDAIRILKSLFQQEEVTK